MIALAIFTASINEIQLFSNDLLGDPDFGPSYILGWIAFVLSLFLAATFKVLPRISFFH